MIEINLLPKHYLKGSRGISLGKVGIYAVAGAVGIALMLSSITFYQTYRLADLEKDIDRANQRAALLKKDIQLVDALTDVKSKISQRMAAVEKLDRHRSVWVRVLGDLAGNIPEFTWLSLYKEKDIVQAAQAESSGNENQAQTAPVVNDLPPSRPIELEGYAFTLNSLASMMINMMRSDYFDEVELKSSQETKFGNDHEKAFHFIIGANVHYLSDEELQKKVALAAKSKESSTTHKVLN